MIRWNMKQHDEKLWEDYSSNAMNENECEIECKYWLMVISIRECVRMLYVFALNDMMEFIRMDERESYCYGFEMLMEKWEYSKLFENAKKEKE